MLNWINSILFIVTAGFCLAQKPMVQLIVDPKIAQVNEEISVTIKTNIQGDLDIDLPPAFVQGYNVMNGMEQEMDYNTGKVITYYYHSMNGAVGKEGSFTFGPAFIKKGSKIYKSNTITIKIENDKPTVSGDVSVKQLKKPAFGVIEKSKSKIYEGEPLILSSRVYSRFNPTHLDGYQSYSLDGVLEKHEIGSGQEIMVDQKSIKGTQMYFFEYDKQVVFPTGTGKIVISPFKMNLKSGIDEYPFISSGAFIEILPLPSNPPKDFIGGVGKLTFTRSIDKTTYKQGDVLVMTIVVSGEGNLHAINTPKLNLPIGMIEYGDPIIEDDYSFGFSGSQGKITYKYNVQLMKDGAIKIPVLSLSYFDVLKQQYITLKENELEIEVAKNTKFIVSSNASKPLVDNEDKLVLSPMKAFVKSKDTNYFISSPLFLLAIISPLSLAFLFIFLKRKKVENTIEIEKQLKIKLTKKEACKELELAELAFKNNKSDEFYISVQRSLFLICSSGLKNSNSTSISKQELIDELISEKVPNQLIEDLRFLFQSCEEARYGLGFDTSIQENILLIARNAIYKLSDHLKG